MVEIWNLKSGPSPKKEQKSKLAPDVLKKADDLGLKEF